MLSSGASIRGSRSWGGKRTGRSRTSATRNRGNATQRSRRNRSHGSRSATRTTITSWRNWGAGSIPSCSGSSWSSNSDYRLAADVLIIIKDGIVNLEATIVTPLIFMVGIAIASIDHTISSWGAVKSSLLMPVLGTAVEWRFGRVERKAPREGAVCDLRTSRDRGNLLESRILPILVLEIADLILRQELSETQIKVVLNPFVALASEIGREDVHDLLVGVLLRPSHRAKQVCT